LPDWFFFFLFISDQLSQRLMTWFRVLVLVGRYRNLGGPQISRVEVRGS
jgi:hypothetical protein